MVEKDEPIVEDKNSEGGDKRWWSEMVREATLTGLATIFMTEDSVRNYIKDKKLPKEFISFLLDGVSKKKEGFYDLVAKEMGKMISRVDLSAEVGKFLERHRIHFEAKISFEPKSHTEIKLTTEEKNKS